MSERKLPNWLDAYMQYTEDSEPPVLFRKWCAVSVIAAALQRKCRLPWGMVNFYPNLYIVLVAPAGRARKGTAMTPARSFIDAMGIPRAAEAVTREALIRIIKEAETVTQSDSSAKPPYIHSSVTVFSPELTVFLGYNNIQLMSDLTDWFDCANSWTYRTKHEGTDDIKGIFLNLLGATTPDLLRSTLPLDAIGGGLTSRIIFVYEEKKGKTVPYPFESPETRERGTILRYDIELIHQLKGDFKVDKSFLNAWGDWYIAQEGKTPFKGFCPHALDGYIERRPTQVLKLSMIMSAAKGSSMILTEQDLREAIQLLEETEVKMPKTFGGIGAADNAPLTYKLLEYIDKEGVSLREITKHFLFDGSLEEITSALQTMVAAGILEQGLTQKGDAIYRQR